MALMELAPSGWMLQFLGLAVLVALALLWIAHRRKLRWIPAWFLRFGLVGLALVGMFATLEAASAEKEALIPTQNRLSILVVQPCIPCAENPDGLIANAQAWLQDQPAWENRLAIYAGAQPVLLTPGLETLPAADMPASDLTAALSLAYSLASAARQPGMSPPGSVQIILAANSLGDQPEAVQALLDEIALHSWLEPLVWVQTVGAEANNPQNMDFAVGKLTAPASWWAGTPFTAFLPVYAPPGSRLSVVFSINGAAQAPLPLVIEKPETWISLDITPPKTLAAGILTLEARLVPESTASDPLPGNNSAFAAVQVYQAARVLMVTTRLAVATSFIDSLTAQGFQMDAVTPAMLPENLAALDKYQVVVLHNFVSKELSLAQMQMLDDFVRGGGGLLFLGGRNAYTLGGYKNTLLEPLLPVILEPPPRNMREPFILALAMDRSFSMSGEPTQAAPIDLAKEAAIRVMETLRPDDVMGILIYSNSDAIEWKVPLGQVGSGVRLANAQESIAEITPFGGTYMFKALEEAIATLEAETADAAAAGLVRHILLLSDGKSSDGNPDRFAELAQRAGEAGISISTFALGKDADADLMREIALASGGRFYLVSDARSLPRIMVSESQGARGANFETGKTGINSGPGFENHPVMNFVEAPNLPVIEGYNAVKPRTQSTADPSFSAGLLRESENILVSARFGDPLLAAWQVGLGRVAAWMSDIGEEWAVDWAASPAAAQFWPQVLRYTLPDPGLNPIQTTYTLEGERVRVQLTAQTRDGNPLTLLSTAFVYVDAAGQARSIPLLQIAPGIYSQSFSAPPPGVYRGVIQYSSSDRMSEIAAPLVLPYPSFLFPANYQASQQALQAWAAHNRVKAQTWKDVETPPAIEQGPQANLASQGFVLLAALVVGWVVEIAIRRRWLPWQ